MTWWETISLLVAFVALCGWVFTLWRSRRAASVRRDVLAAFAARNDAAAHELASFLPSDEENLWRRLFTARAVLEESASEEQRARRELEDVLASLQDAVLVVDEEARLRFLNAAALRLFDLRIEDVLGAHLIEALPSFGIDAAMGAALRDGVPSAHEVHLYSPRLREVLLRVAPVFSASGQEVGAVAILQDLTELRRLERVRRDFVANASHELRTPVANIRAIAETIEGAEGDAQVIARFLPTIVSEAERLSRLVADLLDLARAEASEAPPHTPVQLQNVISNVVTSLEAKARRRSIVVDWQPNGDAPVVEGDPAGLEQVAFNLLDNALSYTPDGGRVELRLAASQTSSHRNISKRASERRRSGDRASESAALPVAILEVRDTGIGIPADDLPRIFERFYRVDKARSRAEGGTGLGLAIVKHIVENHGGHVEVRSQVGQGSTFRVELPVVEARPAA